MSAAVRALWTCRTLKTNGTSPRVSPKDAVSNATGSSSGSGSSYSSIAQAAMNMSSLHASAVRNSTEPASGERSCSRDERRSTKPWEQPRRIATASITVRFVCVETSICSSMGTPLKTVSIETDERDVDVKRFCRCETHREGEDPHDQGVSVSAKEQDEMRANASECTTRSMGEHERRWNGSRYTCANLEVACQPLLERDRHSDVFDVALCSGPARIRTHSYGEGTGEAGRARARGKVPSSKYSSERRNATGAHLHELELHALCHDVVVLLHHDGRELADDDRVHL